MEVNELACLQRACHLYKQGKVPGKTLTRVRPFAIFGKRAQAYATSVRWPIPHFLSSPEIGVFELIFAENKWPIKIEHMEEGIVVKDVN